MKKRRRFVFAVFASLVLFGTGLHWELKNKQDVGQNLVQVEAKSESPEAAPPDKGLTSKPLEELRWQDGLPESVAETEFECSGNDSDFIMTGIVFFGKQIAESHSELVCWLATGIIKDSDGSPKVRFEGWKDHEHPYVPPHEFHVRDEKGESIVYKEPEFVAVAAFVLDTLTRQVSHHKDEDVSLGQFEFDLRQDWARGAKPKLQKSKKGYPF